jgi:hypothetical protein
VVRCAFSLAAVIRLVATVPCVDLLRLALADFLWLRSTLLASCNTRVDNSPSMLGLHCNSMLFDELQTMFPIAYLRGKVSLKFSREQNPNWRRCT